MNIIERGRHFLQSLRQLAGRTVWDWRHCPYCGDNLTCKWGGYWRRPWFLAGHQWVWVQRHWCDQCQCTYSEQSALLVRRSWYAREVHRFTIDHWQHVGSSLRRTAEVTRSLLAHQERWQLWRPLDVPPAEAEACHLRESTVQRWLDRAGVQAKASVPEQLKGVPTSGQMGTDGLWARLRGRTKKVVLVLVDSVSGLVFPPVVVAGEEGSGAWEQMFLRAQEAGLKLAELRGVTSDGAKGLIAYLELGLWWVKHQRCVFHLWRNLAGEWAALLKEATRGLAREVAKVVRQQARQEWVALVRGVWDAPGLPEAQGALAQLAAQPGGKGLAQAIAEHLEAALVHLSTFNRGLLRVSPEWCWRDFRLRLSRGRNQGSELRLERAALVWGIYHNFTPAQGRSERKRKYKRAGLSPLTMAGVPPGEVSYLDALGV